MWTGENGGFRKRRFSVFVWTGENGGFENDYAFTGIGMSQLKKQNGCFFIRFRWSSVDGRKRWKNGSVDVKLFIRFQETENGGFRKRISVDMASVIDMICIVNRAYKTETALKLMTQHLKTK